MIFGRDEGCTDRLSLYSTNKSKFLTGPCFSFFSSLESPDAMFKSGLYINDLSMHDSSRDLVLAGTQQSAELKLALDQVGGAASNSYPPLTTIIG